MSDNESTISMNEHLSAVLDDEAGSFEQRRVLDELKSDKTLSKKLASYALIGETMRTGDAKQQSLTLGTSFLDSIHEKISLEDQFNEVLVDSELNVNQSIQLNQSTSAASKSIVRPIGGFALAASVGALAFMGLQNMGVLTSPTSQPSNFVDSSSPTAIVQATPVSSDAVIKVDTAAILNGDQYVDGDAQTRSMLKRYVDSHMQYATTSALVPSVRVIAYTDNQ